MNLLLKRGGWKSRLVHQHIINTTHFGQRNFLDRPYWSIMSIAEFYIEHGLDPTDPDHMTNFLHNHADSYSYNMVDPVFISRRFVIQERAVRDAPSRTKASSWPLNESELDYTGETRGWEKIEGLPAQPPMASYRKDGVRLNFWLSTGTVGSYLDHPCQGKTQLFRRDIVMSEARDIFDNPRKHTGKGYHTTSGSNNREQGTKRKANSSPATSMRRCDRCGKSKSNDEYSNNQRRKGVSAKCKACV